MAERRQSQQLDQQQGAQQHVVQEVAQAARQSREQATPLSVLQRFRVLVRTAQRHSQWIERQSGVTGAQLWVLQELADQPGLRVGELARRMALHQSTVSNMIDRLETSALISKARTSADQRVVKLSLTAAGQALLESAPQPARGVFLAGLSMLDEDELGSLHAVLEKLLIQIHDLDEGFGMQPLPFTE